MAERAHTYGYLLLILGFQLVVYPIVAHWCWSGDGWLAQRGFLDFAGSGVVHTVGGFASLVGCMFLGPRKGKVEAHSMQCVKKAMSSGFAVELDCSTIFFFN